MARAFLRAGIAALITSVLALSGNSTATADNQYQIISTFTAGVLAAVSNPAAPPAGVNNNDCKLTAAHPRPVVLIQGTFGAMKDNWGALGPILANNGYCVFSVALTSNPSNLVQTVQPLPTSANQVKALVDQLITKYGPETKVDLVGHSQGGLIALYVTKVLNYASKVGTVVGMGATTHGSTISGLATLAALIPGAGELLEAACPACADQTTDSTVVKVVNNGPVTKPGVSYTMIGTKYDLLSTPASATFINEAGVNNKWVQDACGLDLVDHGRLPYNNTTIRLVLNALSPSTAKNANCGLAWLPAVQQSS
ncbi:triacylglycerol esterase/lipase EstA (alpha/beta hydrolase family) [Nocardia tenerifensis]|uniref:Triacylglycerol esterase/lipase EstA (Alpha/beta hydrolase family) n=2 Tax=Nocardia tenerifensis TaxID=228006 RepID=A0A318JTR9_9NOCA|nr:triacylglycerol esterase/lipase EstA (alpha/beta hydrolase family) [Nocardia tenerifensis]